MSRVVLSLVAVLVCSSVVAAGQQVTIQVPPGGPVPPGLPVPPGGGPAMPPRDSSQKTGTARIRGHVFAADNGQALRKAQVRAFSPELRENRMATTDADGVYDLKDLPAGRYTLMAMKGSFVQLQYGQRRPFEPGKPLEIADAQTIEKVDFSLPRGSVITGRVVDEFGEPATDVQVMAMRYQYTQGRRRLTPAGRMSSTNDIGEYRIFGLPPGQYYLSATLRGMMMMPDASSDDRSGYTPTYYPGTANVNEAQRVTVSIGQSLTDINLPLIPARTARISGTAIDSEGKPLASGFVMVMQRTGAMFFSNAGGQIRPDGSFTISNIAPGEYTLNVNTGRGFGDSGESASMPITVAGDDITGVRLVAVKPSTITGRVIVDPAQAASLRPSTLGLMLMPADPLDGPFMGGPGAGKVNDDYTVELKGRPGRQLVRLGPFAPGWSVKSVRLNGVEVADTGFDVRPNEDLTGLEVELTNHASEVSGLVTNARGEVVRDYTVVVFAQDQERWTTGSRYFGQGRPDQDGRFKVRNLPRGAYFAVALDYVDPGEATDPEFLERIRERATTFSLNEAETKTLDLKLTIGS